MTRLRTDLIMGPGSYHPAPIMDAKTALLDVGDRRVDFQCLADRLAALTVQIVQLKAAKRGP